MSIRTLKSLMAASLDPALRVNPFQMGRRQGSLHVLIRCLYRFSIVEMYLTYFTNISQSARGRNKWRRRGLSEIAFSRRSAGWNSRRFGDCWKRSSQQWPTLYDPSVTRAATAAALQRRFGWFFQWVISFMQLPICALVVFRALFILNYYNRIVLCKKSFGSPFPMA